MSAPQSTLWIQCLFVFSVVWSLGGNTDDLGRQNFNTILRGVLGNAVPERLVIFATGEPVKMSLLMPETRSVYDFVFDKSKSKWEFWLNTVESKPLDPEAEYSNIIVPTVDTIRYCQCSLLAHPLINLNLKHNTVTGAIKTVTYSGRKNLSA